MNVTQKGFYRGEGNGQYNILNIGFGQLFISVVFLVKLNNAEKDRVWGMRYLRIKDPFSSQTWLKDSIEDMSHVRYLNKDAMTHRFAFICSQQEFHITYMNYLFGFVQLRFHIDN